MTRACRALLGTTAWLVGVGAPATANADGSAGALPVALGLARCPAVPAGEVRRLIGVELRRPVVLFGEAASVEASAATIVRVTCQDLRAEIEVEDPTTGKTVAPVVDLTAAAPVARPHLLALSIVELLTVGPSDRQGEREPVNPATPVPPPEVRDTPPTAATAVPAPVPSAPRPLRLVVVAAAQASTSGLRSGGGAVVFAGDAITHVGWMTDVAFQHGEQTFTLGRVSADTLSALGAVLGGASRSGAAVQGGLGLRVGGAWMKGAPADPASGLGGTLRGLWWGPVALLDGSVTLDERIVVELTLEAGHVVLPVVADVQGAAPVAINGNWMRGALGVGFRL